LGDKRTLKGGQARNSGLIADCSKQIQKTAPPEFKKKFAQAASSALPSANEKFDNDASSVRNPLSDIRVRELDRAGAGTNGRKQTLPLPLIAELCLQRRY
jgi:hypothetical protein